MKIGLYIRTSPWGDVTPEVMMKKGMGGRESALVNLAQEFGELGHEVVCFVPTSGVDVQEYASGGIVTWTPCDMTEYLVSVMALDFFCSWEDVPILHAVRPYVGVTALEMQVAHLEESLDLTPVDHVCVLSEWAKDFFLSQHPEAKSNMVVLPNGINYELTENPPDLEGIHEKQGIEFIYYSSPDRGLHHLLRMWPKIMKRFAEEQLGQGVPLLHVCYGAEKFVDNSVWSHREDAQRALEIAELMNQRQILYHGKVSQEILAALHKRSDMMLYPADTMQATETGCISIIEALGAGSSVITTDCDCIPSEFGGIDGVTCLPLPFNEEAYIDAIVNAAKKPRDEIASHVLTHDGEVMIQREQFAESRGWDKIAEAWHQRFFYDGIS